MAVEPREAQSCWLSPGRWGGGETAVFCGPAHEPFWVGGLTDGSWTGIQDSDQQWRCRGCRLTQQHTADLRQAAGRARDAAGRDPKASVDSKDGGKGQRPDARKA